MYSAFGVDHGEISKVRASAPRPPRSLTRVLRRRGSAAQRRTAGTGPVVPGSQRGVRGALNRAGEADVSIKGVGRKMGTAAGLTSAFMARHPGITGTATVGGGGALGYKLLSDKEPKRNRKKTAE
jgi:hypothetical protein